MNQSSVLAVKSPPRLISGEIILHFCNRHRHDLQSPVRFPQDDDAVLNGAQTLTLRHLQYKLELELVNLI